MTQPTIRIHPHYAEPSGEMTLICESAFNITYLALWGIYNILYKNWASAIQIISTYLNWLKSNHDIIYLMCWYVDEKHDNSAATNSAGHNNLPAILIWTGFKEEFVNFEF